MTITEERQTRLSREESAGRRPGVGQQADLAAGEHRRRAFLEACGRSASFRVGAAFVATIVALAVLVPLLSPYAPEEMIPGARLLPPSPAHPFGTDALGRDLLSRIGYGAHLAAQMSVFSVGLSLSVGLVLGSLAGYYRGWTDQVLSRIMDAWLALPGALVAIVIVARLGTSLTNLILALGIMGVPSFYRIVRSSTLSARCLPYAEAAVALGATDRRVMWRHVFPNILTPVIVLTTMHMGTTLLMGSSLSFIGLGAQPPQPEWGRLLADGRNHFDTAWWLAVFPGLVVSISVIGLNLLGDGLRDVLDPRLQRAERGQRAAQAGPARRGAAPRYQGVFAAGTGRETEDRRGHKLRPVR